MEVKRVDSKKRVKLVRIKTIDIVKEGTIHYSPRKISSPGDCVNLVREYIDDSDREMFIVITLDTKNQPTAIQTVSIGSLNTSIVHPREVFKLAIISNAATIIVAHNHPSGIPTPSREDIEITERLSEAGKLVGIKVLDHIITGNDDYYSFKEMDCI
ncbi:MAG: DNA repair protein RadC [Clostridia bacterium]|nr:DNA repair protein RadC [Clostridia bacterium]